MKAAVFSDVEGTLVSGSLPATFLEMGKSLHHFSKLKRFQIDAIGLFSRLLPSKFQRYSQLISLLIAIKGETPGQVQELIEQVNPELIKRLKMEVVGRIEAHRKEGLPLILVSAAMHQAVVHLGKEMDGRGEGTHIRIKGGRYITKVEGGICQGEGKAARAREIINEMGLDPALCYAFGDTGSDIPFLALFGHPCAVDPDAKLAAEAISRGWEIIHTRNG
ncbi:MAG: HAD-IB family phosphatase [Chloroflexi bacterium]|uniref:HAD-IB family phosphatase n=1 Tax=Candidatus Chlorohelix allophototropha TaxID=3003348 RepID=A0A8T7M5Z9_9CHLR|nr:HAD-IB family phosphatase [Chloroflexota bacterium]WJW69378.1 HAD-IB family phosphatase [Chloroflexota bacterium L227-S17]